MTDNQTWFLIVTVTAILAWRCGMWWESKRAEREQRAELRDEERLRALAAKRRRRAIRDSRQ